MDLLSQLYYDWYNMHRLAFPNEGEVFERYEEALEQIEDTLDDEAAMKLRSTLMGVIDSVSCNDFCAGLRLGVQLVLEAQKPGVI